MLTIAKGTVGSGRPGELVVREELLMRLTTKIAGLVALLATAAFAAPQPALADIKVGVTVAEVRIKKMKTRWGSCNAAARRIWLNLELAKKPVSCLEYILVHEMVHILERRHNERFRDLMDGLMPSWCLCRDELNRAPLAHEEWRY